MLGVIGPRTLVDLGIWYGCSFVRLRLIEVFMVLPLEGLPFLFEVDFLLAVLGLAWRVAALWSS